MGSVLSVNGLVDRARGLDGRAVDVVGLLAFAFEDRSPGRFAMYSRLAGSTFAWSGSSVSR